MPLLRRALHPRGIRGQGFRRLIRALRVWLLRAAQGLAACIGLYLLAALAGAFVPAGQAGSERDAPSVTIRLLPGPIHYDFLLPLTPETRARFAVLQEFGLPVDHADAEWLVIGWGSEAFYTTVGTWRDLAPRAVWRAVTGDASVLRVGLYGALDPGRVPQQIRFSAAEYERFLDAVVASLRLGAERHPVLVQGPAPRSPGWFFAAEGRFHLFRTCNTWISAMVRAAGLRFGIWTPTPYAVRLSHALYQR